MNEQLKPCPNPECGKPALQTSADTVCCNDNMCPMWSALLSPRAWQSLPRRSDAEPLVEALELIERLDNQVGSDGRCAPIAEAAITTYKNDRN